MRRKVDVRLPGKGVSNGCGGARPVHIIITMIKWIWTSRLSIKNSLSLEVGERVVHRRNQPSRTWFRRGLVFKAHRLLYHSTLGLRAIQKKKKKVENLRTPLQVKEIGILLPNNQRQHRTLHIQKDVLPYACTSSSSQHFGGAFCFRKSWVLA